MSVKQFLTSFVFFKNLALAGLIVLGLMFLFMKSLNFLTRHGQEIAVPNLDKLTVEKAGEALSELNLEYLILDTLDYNPAYPKFTIMQQDPKPGAMVKENRKIYIRINAGTYKLVLLPDFIQKTYRHARANMNQLGLQEGSKTYIPHMAYDVVLEIKQNGKILKAGDKIRKNSAIDIVLGDGKLAFDETEIDSLAADSLKFKSEN